MGSSKPQQPEQRRSEHSSVTQQDHAPEALRARDQPGNRKGIGQVPEENQPGHHPDEDQDKPDRERFRRRLVGQGGTDTSHDPEVSRAAADANPGDTRTHLYQLARRLNVRGRSRMGKRELVDALHAAGHTSAARRDAR